MLGQSGGAMGDRFVERLIWDILVEHERRHKYTKMRLRDVEFALETALRRLIKEELKDLGFRVEEE
jgi:hypothetical protein